MWYTHTVHEIEGIKILYCMCSSPRSYGVVLWEMATLAAQPYQGLANEQVLQYVGSGKIMEMPERCPHKLYVLLVWNKPLCFRIYQTINILDAFDYIMHPFYTLDS